MKEIAVTSEGIIPLNSKFGGPSYPPRVTPEARRLAERHGYIVKEHGSDLLLVKGEYEIKISSHVECFKLVRVPYSWWESCYPGYSVHKERVKTPSWVADFNELLRFDTKGKQALDVLNSLS